MRQFSWLQALDGVVAKLERGAKIADVGCGLGAATFLLARAFPRARLFGYDADPDAIDVARRRARAEGVWERLSFEVARGEDFPGRDYDLVAHLGGLDEAADALATARHAREVLAPDGHWLIVARLAAEARLGDLVGAGGFRRCRWVMRTTSHLVLEARA